MRNSLKIAKKQPFFAIFSLKSTDIPPKTLNYHNINRVSIIFPHFMFISIHKNTIITTEYAKNTFKTLFFAEQPTLSPSTARKKNFLEKPITYVRHKYSQDVSMGELAKSVGYIKWRPRKYIFSSKIICSRNQKIFDFILLIIV